MLLRSTLRPHQSGALTELRSSLLAGFWRPMVCAPTGAGKTVLAAALIANALAKGKRVLFVVPALALINQTIDRFCTEGITDVGVIQADHHLTDASQPVQICSAQTLLNRTPSSTPVRAMRNRQETVLDEGGHPMSRPKMDRDGNPVLDENGKQVFVPVTKTVQKEVKLRPIPKADLVIIDEAHRWFDFYGEWMSHPDWQHVPFIGLSATPGTKGLGNHYNNLITVATTQELIDKGFLSPFKVYAPSHPDLSKVSIVNGDYHEGELSEAMQPLTADVVQTWLQHGRGRPTLCFAVDREHAKKLQMEFEAAGVRAGYVDAFTGAKEREQLLIDFRAKRIEVICNVGVLTTGVDEDVRCLILARPTRSKMLFVQIIGRALRTANGKDYGLILDHSDTHLRLGFVTDIFFTELHDGTKPSQDTNPGEAPKPKACPQCSFVKPPRVKLCPQCGFEATVKTGSDIECEDGELIEITPRRKDKVVSTEEKQRWLSMLMHLAHLKGKPPGWAMGKFNDKFKHWPNGLDKVTTLEPTDDVLGFVKHTNIKNFHRRKKEGQRALSA